MGASQRHKGHRWERDVARMYRDAMPGCDSFRGIQYRDGENAPDVKHPWFHTECKAMKQTNPRAALAQALEHCPEDLHAVAVCKDDNKKPFVCMELESFLELMGQLWTEVR
jgi:hypothetical protein